MHFTPFHSQAERLRQEQAGQTGGSGSSGTCSKVKERLQSAVAYADCTEQSAAISIISGSSSSIRTGESDSDPDNASDGDGDFMFQCRKPVIFSELCCRFRDALAPRRIIRCCIHAGDVPRL